MGWTAETTQKPCVSGKQPKACLYGCRQGGREQGARRGVALEEGPGVIEAVDAAVGHCAPAAASWRGRVVQLSDGGAVGGRSAVRARTAGNP